ncbi:MAG: phytanoyl-CoA dioxygenase family protein [bacterium]|nr:phytanoyl-CoA dioxygenase family protein [Gammaproteobacteria bacterium]HIL96368.1 phytanoyl-CoA dioxygenase family protein [Pseudomonadales bacterium]
MPQLETLPANTSDDDILDVIKRDGACILSNALDLSLAATIRQQVAPFVENTRFGGDDFSGKSTRRTGALVARTPACRDIVTDSKILSLANGFLLPFTEKIILHLTQTINIGPGEGAQVLHRDRLAWGTHLPASIEPQFNTIWALTDFNSENGATRVVPGSNHWPYKRRAEPDEVCQAEMNRGSVLLYTGSVIHSGGENRADESRMGLNITYCLGWLRQEENQYLSCPPHIAKNLEPALQDLLGYSMGNYALGYYSDPEPGESGNAGIQPPERAINASVINKFNALTDSES